MKKRILIVNKFYYHRGGDCIASLNLEKLLKQLGFEVMTYAMTFPQNLRSEHEAGFASQVEFTGCISQKIEAAKRIFGYGDIANSFQKVLDSFKPEIVHLQNIHSYISPIAAKLAKEAGCKVVWTLHDFKLLCPSYSCLREGKPCELCFTDKSNVIKHKCMKGNLAASILAYLEAKKWNRDILEKYVDTFICPSQFMKAKMIQGGFNENKLEVICNFIDPEKSKILHKLRPGSKEDYYLYVGRLSIEKGAETLIKAASSLPFKLKIAGGGPLLDIFKERYRLNSNITFLGHCDSQKIANLISKARFTVLASECYENNPLSIIESLCAGTPVIGANIGGIPELITKDSGITFTSGDETELRNTINANWNADWNYSMIKDNAEQAFSDETHWTKLKKIYEV